MKHEGCFGIIEVAAIVQPLFKVFYLASTKTMICWSTWCYPEGSLVSHNLLTSSKGVAGCLAVNKDTMFFKQNHIRLKKRPQNKIENRKVLLQAIGFVSKSLELTCFYRLFSPFSKQGHFRINPQNLKINKLENKLEKTSL